VTALQYQLIINKLIKQHDIAVDKYYRTPHGQALINKRTIRIPKPVNELTFYICLHEIGHILSNLKETDSNWLHEYEAAKYGIQEAKRNDVIYSKELMECIRGYLRYSLKKSIRKNTAIEDIPNKVFRLAGASKSYWSNKIKSGRKAVLIGEVNDFLQWRNIKIKWK
jgi:hypothetical protein